MAKIIVIDDEKHIGESIERLLTEQGYDCEFFSEPKTALAYLVAGGDAALILLDVWMPEMDGYLVLRKLQENDIKIPVMVMSGHANISLSTQTFKRGAIDFLEKPFLPDVLLAKIKQILEQEGQRVNAKQEIHIPSACLEETTLPQRTIKKNIVLNGIGLHSGDQTGLILSSLPVGSGIIFEDIATAHTVPALAGYVGSTDYATMLECRTFKVNVIEHLMAAFHIYGIDNVRVKVSNEVPILDGSALPFCEALEAAGIEEQDAMKRVFRVKERYTWEEKASVEPKFIRLEPYDGFKIAYQLDLPKEYGNQYHEVEFDFEDRQVLFKREIAPCRTFGFLDETQHLQATGMALGANLGNALLLHDNRVVNSKLRFPNEFARHKIIDILGDFYLLGTGIYGKITARATGHRHNVSLIKKVISQVTVNSLSG
ncbi:UDP-3-O-acyl-N-acetylglucosamine deacetylase [Spirochaetota bacterium]|nr:UDP-3-O-acyl-N-acetylglucosamine deacetylase [Spirochaetota bacterium]